MSLPNYTTVEFIPNSYVVVIYLDKKLTSANYTSSHYPQISSTDFSLNIDGTIYNSKDFMESQDTSLPYNSTYALYVNFNKTPITGTSVKLSYTGTLITQFSDVVCTATYSLSNIFNLPKAIYVNYKDHQQMIFWVFPLVEGFRTGDYVNPLISSIEILTDNKNPITNITISNPTESGTIIPKLINNINNVNVNSYLNVEFEEFLPPNHLSSSTNIDDHLGDRAYLFYKGASTLIYNQSKMNPPNPHGGTITVVAPFVIPILKIEKENLTADYTLLSYPSFPYDGILNSTQLFERLFIGTQTKNAIMSYNELTNTVEFNKDVTISTSGLIDLASTEDEHLVTSKILKEKLSLIEKDITDVTSLVQSGGNKTNMWEVVKSADNSSIELYINDGNDKYKVLEFLI